MKLIDDIIKKLNNSIFNNFSVRDKRQIITLSILLIVIFAVNFCIRTFGNKSIELDDKTLTKLQAFDQQYAQLKESDTLSRLDKYIMQRYDTLQLFEFDPNTATEQQLLKLGLSEKQVSNLVNYRKNGGRFKTSEDFRKLYGLRSLQFRILKPYIVINGKTENNDQSIEIAEQSEIQYEKTTEKIQPEYFEFDPNTISHEEIQKLGFSSKQADSFIKYRQKGKKFYVAKDFASVFFVDNNKYKELEKYIKIDLKKLLGDSVKYDLNLATLQQLESAGMSADEAQLVINFRQKVGNFYANWQLHDCLPYKRAAALKSKFYVCASVDIITLKINTVATDILAEHPYFSARQVSSIDSLRKIKKIQNLDMLKSANIFDDKELKKVKNYLTFN